MAQLHVQHYVCGRQPRHMNNETLLQTDCDEHEGACERALLRLAEDQYMRSAPAATVGHERSSRGGPSRESRGGTQVLGAVPLAATAGFEPRRRWGGAPPPAPPPGSSTCGPGGRGGPAVSNGRVGPGPGPSPVVHVLAPAPRCGAPRRPASQPQPPCPPRPPPPAHIASGFAAPAPGRPGRPAPRGRGVPGQVGLHTSPSLCRRSSRGPACGLRQRSAGPDLARRARVRVAKLRPGPPGLPGRRRRCQPGDRLPRSRPARQPCGSVSSYGAPCWRLQAHLADMRAGECSRLTLVLAGSASTNALFKSWKHRGRDVLQACLVDGEDSCAHH